MWRSAPQPRRKPVEETVLRLAARYNRRAMTDQATPVPPEPDSSRLFALLLKLGLDPEDAYAFVHEVQHMASENLIARFGSKLDELAAGQKAELASLRAEVRSFRWFIAAAIVLGAFIVTLLQLVTVTKSSG